MSTDVNSIIETLIKKRMIVLSVLGLIALSSLGAGYWIQTQQNREKEAANLYDRTWPNIYAVIGEMGNPESTAERRTTAANLYKESIASLDTIILDYPKTVAAARAALLVVRIAEEPMLKQLLGTDAFEAAQPGGLDLVKKAHPKFWSSVIHTAEAIRLEKQNQFAEANASYEAALASDKERFISDFLLVSIARNKEILNDVEGAVKDYQSLVDQYPSSPWNNFALGKIYLLSQAAPAVSQ